MADSAFVPGVPELLARLRALAERLEHYAVRLEHVRDSRCVFTRCYALLIRELAASLESNPAWQDPAWVVTLAEEFARRYFEAIDRYDAGLHAGDAWQHLQDEMRGRRSSVLQDLVLGLIGHIVRDLPLSLDRVWREAAPAAHGVDDYHRVNDVLGSIIAPLRVELERLYNPYLRWLDWLGRSNLKLLTDEGFRLSRAAAWYNGARLRDGGDHAAVLESLERLPVAFSNQLFAPPGLASRLGVRMLNILVSLGRRWPQAPVPDLPLPVTASHQSYYFGVGVGQWRGTFRFAITDWAAFWAASLSPQQRSAALFSIAVMAIVRQARLDSKLDGYPDQGPCGVTVARIRVSVFGLALYALHEQYALGADGRSVHVRGYERVGPLGLGGTSTKSHACRVAEGGMSAHYTVPLFGMDWQGEYQVSEDRNRIDSKLSCAWASATESIERVAVAG